MGTGHEQWEGSKKALVRTGELNSFNGIINKWLTGDLFLCVLFPSWVNCIPLGGRGVGCFVSHCVLYLLLSLALDWGGGLPGVYWESSPGHRLQREILQELPSKEIPRRAREEWGAGRWEIIYWG